MTTASSPRQVLTMQGGDRHDGRAREKKLPGILGDFNLLPIEDCRRCRQEDKLSPIQKWEDGLAILARSRVTARSGPRGKAVCNGRGNPPRKRRICRDSRATPTCLRLNRRMNMGDGFIVGTWEEDVARR